MRFSLFLALASLAIGLEAAPADSCSHNNCLRAVIAENFPLRPTVADCNSFLAVTVTPSTVTYTATLISTQTASTSATETLTETQTLVQTETVLKTLAARSVDAVPTYATACTKPGSYASACSCIGIAPTTVTLATPSTTVTVVSEPTVTSTFLTSTTKTETVVTTTSTTAGAAAPSLCGNQGLRWAYYDNISGRNTDSEYSSFHAEDYKSATPRVTGITTSIGGIDIKTGGTANFYGSADKYSVVNFVLNHAGYIFAPKTGTYTVTVTGVDDAVDVWIGAVAYAGWTRANANLRVAWATQERRPGTGSFSIDLLEGEYLPLRIMFAQGQGGATFKLAITAPDGSDFLSANTPGSPYVIINSCDGVTAPPFPPFGSEV